MFHFNIKILPIMRVHVREFMSVSMVTLIRSLIEPLERQWAGLIQVNPRWRLPSMKGRLKIYLPLLFAFPCSLSRCRCMCFVRAYRRFVILSPFFM